MKKLLSFLLTLFFTTLLFAQAPGNDNCANARIINTDSVCVNNTSKLTGQTLTNATTENFPATATCSFIANTLDVWYKFIAKTGTPTITISSLGVGWTATDVRIQLLQGTCGSFTELYCTTGLTITPTLANQLTPGTTYYIRIHKNVTTAIGANHSFSICVTDVFARSGRMNEVFSRTILSGPSVMNYPWEVTYGPDDSLWVTEAKGYKVQRIDPKTGGRVTVLDLTQGSNFLPSPDNTNFNCAFGNGSGAQGGFAGLALHPNFLDGTANEKNYVFISYVKSRQSAQFFTNSLVRFTFNKTTGLLGSPLTICDTLPGSNDHNSQRIFIAPVVKGGTSYLFYASGDMGAGQGNGVNVVRAIRAQLPKSYEGKILRFNVDPDGDGNASDKWIPNDNPYNTTSPAKQCASWAIGIRNNQGFAYDSATNTLYGSSHGAYSDDEINILQRDRNYGHPLVIGYTDGNYDGTTAAGSAGNNLNISAGAPYLSGITTYGNSSCPPIGSEATRVIEMNASPFGAGLYKEPLFSGYPGIMPVTAPGSVRNIWQTTNGSNGLWPSEAWSGLDLYNNNMIPGWYKSLIAAGLKWGRLIKLRLGDGDSTIVRTAGADTVTLFQSLNRYRDLAIAPNGRDFYIVMDHDAATSNPGNANPIVPSCADCLVKYSFLGYGADANGFSTISKQVVIAKGTAGTCNTATTVVIDGTNNFLWVPITGPDGNIVAEINANGNNLDTVRTSYYINGGTIRANGSARYLDRNIRISVKNQPTLPTGTPKVYVRFYFTKEEFNRLDADPNGVPGTGAVNLLKILKNNDNCRSAASGVTVQVAPTNLASATNYTQDTSGFVLQGEIASFSSFYFGTANLTLPLEFLTFTGALQSPTSALLKWKTDNEINTSHFVLERSIDAVNFTAIGNITASGNTTTARTYSFTDNEVADQLSLVVFYRLKQLDNDGKFKYSSIVSVTLADITGTVTVSPNPVTTEATVAITAPAEGTVIYSLVDNAGRTILQSTLQVKKGALVTVPVNMTKLASGLYFINVDGAGLNKNIKIQKL